MEYFLKELPGNDLKSKSLSVHLALLSIAPENVDFVVNVSKFARRSHHLADMRRGPVRTVSDDGRL